jgi:hypothetical protein
MSSLILSYLFSSNLKSNLKTNLENCPRPLALHLTISLIFIPSHFRTPSQRDDDDDLVLIDDDIDLIGMANSSERGQAVEPSSRVNPSRCVRKCRFPLLGGLHRSSLDSPAATPPIPDWCFVNKSNSTSSMRTRVAATAFLSKAKEGTPIRSQSHKRVCT